MTFEMVWHPGGSYTLMVNGVARVHKETFSVCSGVRFHLEHPEAYDGSELAEVARSIRPA